MSESFKFVTDPHMPLEISAALKATYVNFMPFYRGWCHNNLGPMLGKGRQGRWYQSGSILFFMDRADALLFMLNNNHIYNSLRNV